MILVTNGWRRVVIIAGMLAAVGGTLSAQTPRFGSRVDLVVISAVVRDSQNAMVRGLTKDDFEILEDGKPIAVSTFAEVNADNLAPQDDGRFVVLLLDDLLTDPLYAARIKAIAHAFADRMGRRDVVSVIFLNKGSSTATRNQAEVRAAINKFMPFGRLLNLLSASSHAIETVGNLAAQLQALPHRRKVLVAIGPAMLFNPPLRSSNPGGKTGKAITATARAGVTTYVIDPFGLTPRRPPGRLPAGPPVDAPSITSPGTPDLPGNISRGPGVSGDMMVGFARETGGTAFANLNVFEAAVDQVWEESGTYYLFGYEPARRDDKRHVIEVRVKKPDMSARARTTR